MCVRESRDLRERQEDEGLYGEREIRDVRGKRRDMYERGGR